MAALCRCWQRTLDGILGLVQHRGLVAEDCDMFELSDRETGKLLATVDELTFAQLGRSLASEYSEDRDRWIEAGTLSVLTDAGVDHALPKVRGAALGARESMEVAWKRGS
jgi:hypothetical protein